MRCIFGVAGTVFGDAGVLLFVAGAALGEVLIDSRSAKCCIFQNKMLGSWSDYPRTQRVSSAILSFCGRRGSW